MVVKNTAYYRMFLVPTVIFLTVLSLFPFAYTIILSLTNHNMVSTGNTTFVGLENFACLLNDGLFLTALKNTFFIVAAAVAVETVIGLLMATSVFHYLRGLRKSIQTILVLPMALSPVAVALMWKYMFNSTYGIINYFMGRLGLDGVDWLGSVAFSKLSIIIVDIWQWTPFVFIIALAGLESIPHTSLEMGKVDGANRLQLSRLVILPQIMPFVLVAILLRTIDAFKLFDVVYILTEGGPGSSSEVLSLIGYRLGFVFFQSGLASAESIVLLLIVVALTSLLIRTMKRLFRDE